MMNKFELTQLDWVKLHDANYKPSKKLLQRTKSTNIKTIKGL